MNKIFFFYFFSKATTLLNQLSQPEQKLDALKIVCEHIIDPSYF